MKNIFLTGATGVMGMAGLKELTSNPDKYNITVLARPTKKNRKKLKSFQKNGVNVIWGNFMDYTSVERGVKDADIVLHVGGMVSPMADWFPKKTIKVNTTSMKFIIDAVSKLNPEAKVVYIGSVAQYGNYEVPYHWGQCGDILSPAKFDSYAYSKVEAEKLLACSGIKKWVSLRQTGILHHGLLLKASDPIAFHVPIRGVLEWVTAEDSGRLLERVCRDSVPDSFWNNFYNIGGGEKFRLTNYEFETMLLKALGCPPPEKIFESNWFATQNFHGCWYKDSDKLESILHFRSQDTPEEYFKKMRNQAPWYIKLAPLAPAILMKAMMKSVANKKILGPMNWIKENNTERIDAAFGSRVGWENIPDWPQMDLSRPSDQPEETDVRAKDLSFENFKETVKERGGEIVDEISSDAYNEDKNYSLKCSVGHLFRLTPRAVISGGHWCGDCLKMNL